jgi:beta-aspartyl-peptidase (threonine type)
VGDSPLIGCGCYADAEAGGVSCTGYGEAIMRVVLAKAAVDCLRPLSGGVPLGPQQAAQEAVRLLKERGKGAGGLILLDRHGRPGFAFNTPHMAYGYVAADGSFLVAV